MIVIKLGGSIVADGTKLPALVKKLQSIETPSVGLLGTGPVRQLDTLVEARMYGSRLEVPKSVRMLMANKTQACNEILISHLLGLEECVTVDEICERGAQKFELCNALSDEEIKNVYGSDIRAILLARKLGINNLLFVKSAPIEVPILDLTRSGDLFDYGFHTWLPPQIVSRACSFEEFISCDDEDLFSLGALIS
jgi:hypothetical protein